MEVADRARSVVGRIRGKAALTKALGVGHAVPISINNKIVILWGEMVMGLEQGEKQV